VADLLGRIRHSIEPDDARILDRASASLGTLRERRRENAQTLRRDIEDWARRLHAQGVSERPQVLASGISGSMTLACGPSQPVIPTQVEGTIGIVVFETVIVV
jgi:hypothetical protein